MKTAVELILPLLDQHARADNEAAVQVATDEELFDEESGHNGLAGAGVVGQEKA
jgi:hypothetical protein